MRIKMHSVDEGGTIVPAFLAKLWKIVEDPDTNDLIRWSAEGASFIIQNTARFSRELLPLYYKHNNMASFIRQLNMYGFHKVVSLEAGGLKVDKDEMEFAHPCFVNGHPYLLENIKRKIPNKLEGELRPGSRSDVYGKVLTEVKNMKGRQESLSSQLVAMKRENEVLWREVALLREKHKQQQTIVNKLVHFFVNLFQSDEAGNLRLKRQARLMIKDKVHSAAKFAKLDPDVIHRYSCEEDRSPEGPVIHEIDASELLNGYSATELSEEETTMLPQDLCDAVEKGEVENLTLSLGSSSQQHKDDRNPGDLLLDVCPDIIVSPAPLDINAVMAEVTDAEPRTIPKAPSSAGRGREVKRKRRRRSTGTHPMSTCLTTHQDDGLTIILPLDESVDDPAPVEMIVSEMEQPETSSVDAATKAAIQAISSVANASEEKTAATFTPTTADTSMTTTVITPATTTLATNTTTAMLDRWGVKEQLDNHVGEMQSELDNIRELLKTEGYGLDDSMLLGVRLAPEGLAPDVFTKIFSDDPLTNELSEIPSSTEKDKENQEFLSDPLITGGELILSGTNGLTEFTDFLDWSQVSDAPNDYELILGDLNTPQMVPSSPGVSK